MSGNPSSARNLELPSGSGATFTRLVKRKETDAAIECNIKRLIDEKNKEKIWSAYWNETRNIERVHVLEAMINRLTDHINQMTCTGREASPPAIMNRIGQIMCELDSLDEGGGHSPIAKLFVEELLLMDSLKPFPTFQNMNNFYKAIRLAFASATIDLSKLDDPEVKRLEPRDPEESDNRPEDEYEEDSSDDEHDENSQWCKLENGRDYFLGWKYCRSDKTWKPSGEFYKKMDAHSPKFAACLIMRLKTATKKFRIFPACLSFINALEDSLGDRQFSVLQWRIGDSKILNCYEVAWTSVGTEALRLMQVNALKAVYFYSGCRDFNAALHLFSTDLLPRFVLYLSKYKASTIAQVEVAQNLRNKILLGGISVLTPLTSMIVNHFWKVEEDKI